MIARKTEIALPVRALKAMVESRIADVVCCIEPETLRYALQQNLSGGKLVRPVVTMLACGAAGGKPEQAIDAAAAIELLHTSSLIHDDIMDGAPLRRGVPATHVAFGMPMAILAGDTLVALSFELISGIASPNRARINRLLAASFRQVCEGQGHDLCLDQSAGSGAFEHVKMVEKKTASLLEAASRIGALLSTNDATIIAALGRYGYYLGMAFQAQDDLLDACGDEGVMGKPARVDAKNGKRTFLSSVQDERSVLSRDATAGLVREYTLKAVDVLAVLPASRYRSQLQTLAELLVRREG